MKFEEKRILRELYFEGKKKSSPPDFISITYYLPDILKNCDLQLEGIKDILRMSSYLSWLEPDGIELTPEGLLFCQSEFENRKMGFVPD